MAGQVLQGARHEPHGEERVVVRLEVAGLGLPRDGADEVAVDDERRQAREGVLVRHVRQVVLPQRVVREGPGREAPDGLLVLSERLVDDDPQQVLDLVPAQVRGRRVRPGHARAAARHVQGARRLGQGDQAGVAQAAVRVLRGHAVERAPRRVQPPVPVRARRLPGRGVVRLELGVAGQHPQPQHAPQQARGVVARALVLEVGPPHPLLAEVEGAPDRDARQRPLHARREAPLERVRVVLRVAPVRPPAHDRDEAQVRGAAERRAERRRALRSGVEFAEGRAQRRLQHVEHLVY